VVPQGRFAGKVGIVTAGAGGIGASTAQAFALEGTHVVIVDVDADGGTKLCRSLTEQGLSAEFQACDVTSGDQVADLFKLLTARHPRLDFAANVVGGNGAGDTPDIELHDQTEAPWDATMSLSLRPTFLCMKEEIGWMLRGGGGSIVNVSSMAGLHVTPYATPAYSAAKAAVVHLTRYAAVIYAERSIRVNAVAPGLTLTPNAVAAMGEEDMTRAVAGFHCIPRGAQPADQASAIVWLCSDDAAMVTGHTIPVDGGWDAR
jgi:NAD(P)-dependent dehydrogenase (short-subunit alcohol dehydrogenase family)